MGSPESPWQTPSGVFKASLSKDLISSLSHPPTFSALSDKLIFLLSLFLSPSGSVQGSEPCLSVTIVWNSIKDLEESPVTVPGEFCILSWWALILIRCEGHTSKFTYQETEALRGLVTQPGSQSSSWPGRPDPRLPDPDAASLSRAVSFLWSPPFVFKDSPCAFEMVCDWVCGHQRSTQENSVFKTEVFTT